MARQKSIKELSAKVLDGSQMRVVPAFVAGEFSGLLIELEGPVAQIPSCNSKEIAYRYVMSKGKKKLVPFQRKSNRQLAMLAVLTQLYGTELVKQSVYPPPALGSIPVTLYLIASGRNRGARWDSSNLVKLLSDWIEDVGIIEDDSQLEGHAYKATEYGGDDGTTRIIILARELTQADQARCIENAKGYFSRAAALGGIQS